MGIKNFHKFLRKHSPEFYQETPLSHLAHKTVAIDISIYLFKYKSSYKDKWLNTLLSLILLLKKYNIQCICIYDTKAPMEKNARKAERKQRKVNAEERIREIHCAVEQYQTHQTISQILLDISNKRSGHLKKVLNMHSDTVDMRAVEYELSILENQIINITRQDIQVSKQLLDLLGVPHYDADGEAETLCAHLCLHGQVDGVLSDDTDVLVYGTPLFVTKLNTRSETCVLLNPHAIARALNLSFHQFVDLCIMSGTDYNDNIPNIGNEKAFQLIKKFHSIEGIEKEKQVSTECLNYRRVRELFQTPITLAYYKTLNGCPNVTALREFAQFHRIPLSQTRWNALGLSVSQP